MAPNHMPPTTLSPDHHHYESSVHPRRNSISDLPSNLSQLSHTPMMVPGHPGLDRGPYGHPPSNRALAAQHNMFSRSPPQSSTKSERLKAVFRVHSSSTDLVATDTKHVPCKFFRLGQCSAGDTCPYSHNLEASIQPCQYFLNVSDARHDVLSLHC